MHLSQTYIYRGQIFGPGEVDLSEYEDEEGYNQVEEDLQKREDALHAKDEPLSLTDPTQSSRLLPRQIVRTDPEDATEETITPLPDADAGAGTSARRQPRPSRVVPPPAPPETPPTD